MSDVRTLILTDNAQARDVSEELQRRYRNITIRQSPNGALDGMARLSVKRQCAEIIANYDLVISVHCKQIFPAALVHGVRCVNVHPGLNPYNRGWFPQVFSIINGLPTGVTIHEIDEQLDHGPIIAQQEYAIEAWDTSASAYEKIMAIERAMLLQHFVDIRDRRYRAREPAAEGNINLKGDFDALKEISLDEVGSFRTFVNRLRALTHGNYKNAYFISEAGEKVYLSIQLEKAKD